MTEPKPPKLPPGAPRSLRDFVSCRTDEVVLDPRDTGWLPSAPGSDDPIDIEISKGRGKNRADLKVGWGFISITMPVSIDDAGNLVVDTSQAGPFEYVLDDVEEWVERFNGVLGANGKRLTSIEVTRNGPKLTKGPKTPPVDDTAAAHAATSPPVTAPPTSGPAPKKPALPMPGGGTNSGCFLLVLAALTLLGFVSWLAFFRGGDDDTVEARESNAIAEATRQAAEVITSPSPVPSPTTEATFNEPQPVPSSEVPIETWGVVPVEPSPVLIRFDGTGDCATPQTGEAELVFDWFPSARGLAGGISGFGDGAVLVGEGSFEFVPRPLRISRNDVESTEFDWFDFDFTAGTGEWFFVIVDGDVPEPDPSMGTTTECGTFTMEGPGYGQVTDAVETSPALDMEVENATELSCRSDGTDLVVTGRAPGFAPGTPIVLVVEISGTEYRALPQQVVEVGPDGSFTAVFPGEAVEGDVSARVSHGVYSLGGQFLSSCDGG